LIAAVLASACADDKPHSSGSRDRVNAVQARPTEKANPEATCDVFHSATAAPGFDWPKLVAPAPAATSGSWRWINVWATWCKPCVEELPRLVKWHAGRKAGSARVELILVSADETDDEVAGFRKAHPETPAGPRMADPEELPGWLKALGVPGASLPVHVFVDPSGKVRCVRASAIEVTDFPTIEAMLGGA